MNDWEAYKKSTTRQDRSGAHYVHCDCELRFKGEAVASGTGEHKYRMYVAQAKKWNQEGYAPSSVKHAKCRADGGGSRKDTRTMALPLGLMPSMDKRRGRR